MKHRFILLGFAIALPLLFSGCYDSKDIENVSAVLAAGCDRVDDKNVFSFAIAQIKSKDNGSEVPTDIKSVEADNIYDALYELQKTQSKTLSLTHIECAVFSKNTDLIFKDTVKDMTERLNVNSTSVIAICDGEAKDFLEKTSESHETDFALYLNDIFKKQKLVPKLTVYDAYCSINAKKTLCMPILKEKEDDFEYSICVAGFEDNYKAKELTDINAINFYSVLKGYTNTLVIKDDFDIIDIHLKDTPKLKYKDNTVLISYTLDDPDDLKYRELVSKQTDNYFYQLKNNNADIMDISELSKRDFLTYDKWLKYDFYNKFKDMTVKTEVNI